MMNETYQKQMMIAYLYVYIDTHLSIYKKKLIYTMTYVSYVCKMHTTNYNEQ